MAKNKHLTDSERLQIEQQLRNGMSLNRIAAELGKSASTVSREIRAHAIESNKYAPYRIHNRCAKLNVCRKMQICVDKPNCTRKCSTCNFCNAVCEEFEERLCVKLYEPPYVCNGCTEEYQCILRKKYYLHKKAHEAYCEMLVESRAGANITEDELLYLDEWVSPLIQRGQSIHHIAVHNADKLEVSEKSLYRYVSGGLLKAKNIDMPRVCRLKPRKTKLVEHKIDSACRIGRTYADFLKFIETSDAPIVEIDSVIGRVGGKVLLTIMFRSCDLMLAFIRERNTSQSVIDIFNLLYGILGADRFKTLFPIIIADNGSEFSNPKALEYDAQGNQRSRIFYGYDVLKSLGLNRIISNQILLKPSLLKK